MLMTIGLLSAQLGVSPDALRKWESRHGFPVPQRTAGGTRVYDDDQLGALREVKRAVDQGMPLAEALRIARLRSQPRGLLVADCDPLQDALLPEHVWRAFYAADLGPLHTLLMSQRARLSPPDFVELVAAPLMRAVGKAWAQGQLRIGHEHAISGVVQSVLDPQVSDIGVEHSGTPIVLLSSPPGERHALGLAMTHFVFVSQGARCINLGPETPVDELLANAREWQADIVGISLSAAHRSRAAQTYLAALRSALPEHCELWVGGAGATLGGGVTPANAVVCCDSAQLLANLASWRARSVAPRPQTAST